MSYEGSFDESIRIPDSAKELAKLVARDYEVATVELNWEASRIVQFGSDDQYNRSLHSTYSDGNVTFAVCGARILGGRADMFTLSVNKYGTSTGSSLDQEMVTIDDYVIWQPSKRKPFSIANRLTSISRYPDEQWEVSDLDLAGPLIVQAEDGKVCLQRGRRYLIRAPSFGRTGRPNTEAMIEQTIVAKRMLGYLAMLDEDSKHNDAYF